MAPHPIEVALPVAVDDTVPYVLPEGQVAEPGTRVLVPYGRRKLTGVVVPTPLGNVARPRRLRPVHEVLDPEPVLPGDLMDVVLQAARDVLCPPGIALAAALPPGTAPRVGRRVVRLEAGRRALERGEAPGPVRDLLTALGSRGLGESTVRQRYPEAAGMFERLERLGWLRREERSIPGVRVRTEPVYRLAEGVRAEEAAAANVRAPRRQAVLRSLAAGPRALPSSPSLRALVAAGLVAVEEREVQRLRHEPQMRADALPLHLTSHQHAALVAISRAIQGRLERILLLHGITGSGKTEVYLRAADVAVQAGRGVIVLVPEISLTHQTVDRFRARFGDRVAVLHSGLSPGERFDQWRHIRGGRYTIAIGARSAVFAPFADVGLIVIDEEHDTSYRSEEGFRYHAREVARLRARVAGAPLVLGSATPDVETAWRVQTGELERLVLPERVERRPLPRVEIVDMGNEPRGGWRRSILSGTLRRALGKTLAERRQAILFLNRRGFATLIWCAACGHALRCEHCDISLVYHASGGPRRPQDPVEGELRCHYCGATREPPDACPACGEGPGALLGFGTERLVEEVAVLFPHARVARLDRDSTARKGEQRRILAAFHRGELDVLVGTQMVAKGHDVPGVTLVGVVAADLGLHFPDFRASERTFQLLAQVAGRAGRGDEPGRVVIQTFLPEHYAVALARTHDYEGFLREELRRREPHGYPPFRSLVRLLVQGPKAEAVETAAAALGRLARTVPLVEGGPGGFEVLGPAPAPLTRIRDAFRWQVVLLGHRDDVRNVARELRGHARRHHRGVALRVDVAPLSML